MSHGPTAAPGAPGVATASGGGGALRVLAHPAFPAGNLYNTMLYRHLQAAGARVDEFTPGHVLRGRYDVVHLHWPEAPLNSRWAARAWGEPLRLLALLDWARRRGARVVWTVHNLRAHDGLRPRLERGFWRAFLRRVDGAIHLSQSGRRAALEHFPALRGVPGWVVQHGHYRGAYPDTLSRAQAREGLGIGPDAPVVAFVGQVREYKHVPGLVRAFGSLDDPAAELLVAGRIRSGALEAEVRAAARGARVRLFPGFIPDGDLQRYLKAADLVALPFREVLNSGSALLALSFNRPVLVPRRGAMAELRDTVGPDWVRTYEGELTPATLAQGLEWARGTARAAAPLEALDWAVLAGRTLDAYRAVSAI